MQHQPPSGAPYVVIVDGPFAGFEGAVSGIDQANNIVYVTISFFGRKQTTVKLDVRQVRRVVA